MNLMTIMIATTVNFTVQTATHPDDFKNFDTTKIRERFVMEKVMEPDRINVTYTMYDRLIYGGAMPVEKELTLDTFEELKAIIDRVESTFSSPSAPTPSNAQPPRLGICLDTCHVWDGGYDIVNDLDGVLAAFDRIIGLDRLKAIHTNDSMNVLGAHKDRHEKIGKGKIGLDAFARIVNHPKLRDLPFYLETPCDLQGYKEEIALLKGLRA